MTIIAAMQDLLLLFESSKTGWKTHDSLKGCHPESVTFDHRNPNLLRAYYHCNHESYSNSYPKFIINSDSKDVDLQNYLFCFT